MNKRSAKLPGDPRSIRFVQWEGERPKFGDTLKNTRSRFQVVAVQDKPPPFRIDTIVMAPEAPDAGTVFHIYSVPRKTRRRIRA